MYAAVHSDMSQESYPFELFDLPLDVPLVCIINQGYMAYASLSIPFDLRCESVKLNVIANASKFYYVTV